LFSEVTLNQPGGKHFHIKVEQFSPTARYVQKATLNGKPLNRNWLTHEELMKGGELMITASEKPNEKWGTEQLWVPGLE